jgi:hypothetical protein
VTVTVTVTDDTRARITANRMIGPVQLARREVPGDLADGRGHCFMPRASHTTQVTAIQTADPASHASVCADALVVIPSSL